MRSSVAAPPLVRLLAHAGASAGERDPDVIEGLSRWVTAFDAIGLQASLRAIQAMPLDAPAPQRASAALRGLADDFERTRGTLGKAIALDATLPNEFTYAAYRRRHLELQRQMEQLVEALRDHVRQVLARATPALRRLAALDAALAPVIARREEALLPVVTKLLERRFNQTRKAYLATLDTDDADIDDAQARRPGGWLHAFEREWREVLLAERDLRLEPVAGLVEAAGLELDHTP